MKEKGMHTAALAMLIFLTFVLGCSSAQTIVQEREDGNPADYSAGFSETRMPCVRADFLLEYTVKVLRETPNIELTVAIPKTIENRQDVKDIMFTQEPERVFDVGWGRYAVFQLERLAEDCVIGISGSVDLFKYDFSTAEEESGETEDEVPEIYLMPEKHIESDSSAVQKAASEIEGEEDVDIVRNVFNYVLEKMTYTTYNPHDVGAEKAIASWEGDCTEYSDIFVAICRAKGIPARFIEGYCVNPASSIHKHNWVEAYMRDYGWVPFDLTFADSGHASFENTPPQNIIVSDLRNDENLGGYHFYYYKYENGAAEVESFVEFILKEKK